MTTDIDSLLGTYTLKKSLRFWRIAALVLALFAVVALAFSISKGGAGSKNADHIARITLSGEISDDLAYSKMLSELEKNPHVKGVVLLINSPGGTTTASEDLFQSIRDISQKRPVVSVMQSVAASGGYLVAIAGDRVIARGNTITGSIGVLFQWPKVSKLLDTLGVAIETIRSGELKAQPDYFTEPSEKVRAVSTQMVLDSYNWFIGLVSERRKLPLDEVKTLSDGRVYTGRQALKVKLIDALGGEKEAVEWLKKDKKIGDFKVVDWEPERDAPSPFWRFLGAHISTGLGGESLSKALKPAAIALEHTERRGLYMLWTGE